MTVSAFELFRVGIGPSSSHTVGPMRAAAEFVSRIDPRKVCSVDVELFGSLAATGRGHGTLTAVLLGLEGLQPETVLPEHVERRRESIRTSRRVRLGSVVEIPLCEDDIVLAPWDHLPGHSNALRLSARGVDGDVLASEVYYSVGGGFIQRDGDAPSADSAAVVPYPFGSAAELLAHCESEQCSIAEIVMRNETVSRGQFEVRRRLLEIWDIMQLCVRASVARSGTLPGPLQVPRRAPDWHRRVTQLDPTGEDPAHWLERLNMVALAVNEENATGGRVVTAPTNGAAGIIPAVLDFALRYSRSQDLPQDDATVRFLLTATAIGSIVKQRASLSGAEVGCQGEVGSASSMAAAGLAAVLGGSPRQVENAAEIAMEHNLGLTCDPVGGLVQIPCIERNAIAATKAVNAAKMALWGDGSHIVSLDAVIETMRQTGLDMSTSYKETSTGGLAVNVVEC